MLCLDCQRIVLKGDSCDKCGKTLAGFSELPKGVSDKAGELKKKSLLLRSGDMTKAEFLQFLDQQEDSAWKVMDETEDSNFQPDEKADIAEELSTGRKGVGTYLKALETARQWVETGNYELLQTAIALAAKSDNYMQQTLELNWAAYRNYMESTREFLAQQGFTQD